MKTNTKLFGQAGRTGVVIGSLIVGTIAVPVTWADDVHVGINIGVPTPSVEVAPDDYVYYPAYGAYYSPRHHRYYYQEHGSWIWGNTPPGVSSDVVLASPSVKMDFHDSPAKHHAEILRKYPKDWTPHHDR